MLVVSSFMVVVGNVHIKTHEKISPRVLVCPFQNRFSAPLSRVSFRLDLQEDYQSPGFSHPTDEVSAPHDEKELALLRMDFPEFMK